MEQQERPCWRPTRRQVLLTLGIVAVLTAVIFIGYRYGITLWDWIKLLVVPAVIAGVGIWFNHQQRERELESAREQREREQYIEDQRAQDAALQAYLDQMGQLLLDRDRPLSQAKKGDAVSTLARSLTLTALSQVDGRRKGTLIQFLSEARLIQGSPDMAWRGGARSRPIIELTSADLRDIDLSDAALDYVMLSEANLSGANLRGADLSNAILFNADLTDADLLDATVSWWGGLNSCKSLKGATMPNGQIFEEWREDNKGLVDKTRHAAEYEDRLKDREERGDDKENSRSA